MSLEETTTIRVRRLDSKRLQSLAKARKRTVIDVMHEAIDALERLEFLRELGDDYRQLHQDPASRQAFMEERAAWDQVS